jgi:hypothetical protein
MFDWRRKTKERPEPTRAATDADPRDPRPAPDQASDYESPARDWVEEAGPSSPKGSGDPPAR